MDMPVLQLMEQKILPNHHRLWHLQAATFSWKQNCSIPPLNFSCSVIMQAWQKSYFQHP
jgi:hypothetical protein